MLERRRRHRAAEQISLHEVAAMLAEEVELLAPFHLLGNHLESEIVCEREQRADDRAAAFVVRQWFHERSADLQAVQREVLKMGDAGVARAEVVEPEVHAQLAD